MDTTSRDGSAELIRESLGDLSTPTAYDVVPGSTSFPDAVRPRGPSLMQADDPDEWVWLLHDDANPAPGRSGRAAGGCRGKQPDAAILGPKLREWPSLRRLLEVGLTISGTGRRETGLEHGEYDQGQHDETGRCWRSTPPACSYAGSVLEELGGLDAELPIFGNDIDFGWRGALPATAPSSCRRPWCSTPRLPTVGCVVRR